MSNIQRIENLEQVVNKLEPDFTALAKVHGAVNFKREASFAMQILKDNQYLMKVALENQDSLRMAIINVASIGLTLSPLRSLAYLVPRKGKVCLDISYRGFVQLGAECGAIQWAKAEIVFENDEYKYFGVGKEPLHKFEPFDTERGKMIGVFCLAKTHADQNLVEHMTIDEVYNIRNRSESWKAYKAGKASTTPWITDEREMIKKTVIRRASKMWPMVSTKERFERAVEAANEADPLELPPAIGSGLADQIMDESKIRELCEVLGKKEEDLIAHLVRGTRRDIKKLSDLTPIEAKQTLAMLDGMLPKKGKK